MSSELKAAYHLLVFKGKLSGSAEVLDAAQSLNYIFPTWYAIWGGGRNEGLVFTVYACAKYVFHKIMAIARFDRSCTLMV